MADLVLPQCCKMYTEPCSVHSFCSVSFKMNGFNYYVVLIWLHLSELLCTCRRIYVLSLSLSPLTLTLYQTSVWVNFFFWLIIGGLVFFQRRKGSSEYRGGGEDAGASPSETEPFLNRPGQPKWPPVPTPIPTPTPPHPTWASFTDSLPSSQPPLLPPPHPPPKHKTHHCRTHRRLHEYPRNGVGLGRLRLKGG